MGATIALSMTKNDKFLIVAHDMKLLPDMYSEYYAKVVGEANEEASNFDEGLFVSKGDYRSQWFSPETLTARVHKYTAMVEESCDRGPTAGVYGIYALPTT